MLCALLAPWLAPYDFDAIDLTSLMQGPSWSHPLGTDELGRDILSRVIYGARTSVIVCITAALLSLAISVTLGVLSGYFGGRLDALVQRFVDTWQSFPDLIVLIAGVAVLGPGIVQIIALLGILYGVAGSRIVRGAVLSAREQLYVQAGHSFGAGNGHIILRHILPTIAAPLIVLYTTRLGGVILVESSLSFLGLGVPPPAPAWGRMLSDARPYMFENVWMVAAPGLAITLIVFCVNIFGDSLRDLLDPRGIVRN